MQTKQEVLQFVGIMLLFVGLFSFVQSPTLGIFKLGLLQEILCILSGIYCFYLTVQKNKQILNAKILMGIFGVIGVLNFLLHGTDALPFVSFQIATGWLYLFLAGVFAYIGFGKPFQEYYSVA